MLLKITEITSNIPFSKIYVKTPYIYQMIIYYAVIFGINYLIKTNKIEQIKKYKNKIIAVVLIITLIPSFIEIFPNKNLKIYFIDVGQGDSCLIVTPNNKKILIDRRR